MDFPVRTVPKAPSELSQMSVVSFRPKPNPKLSRPTIYGQSLWRLDELQLGRNGPDGRSVVVKSAIGQWTVGDSEVLPGGSYVSGRDRLGP